MKKKNRENTIWDYNDYFFIFYFLSQILGCGFLDAMTSAQEILFWTHMLEC